MTLVSPTPICRILLVGLLLTLGLHLSPALRAQAQPQFLTQPQPPQPPPMDAQVSVFVVEAERTREVKMTTGKKIANVRNENPKVARVQTKQGDPTAVLVTGLSPGTSRMTMEDENKTVEVLDILVPDEGNQQFQALRKRFLELVRTVVPTASVDAVGPGSNTIIVTGYVTDAQMVQAVLDIARSVFNGANVQNYIRVGGVQQVQLEVTVAIVNRQEARNLAANFFANGTNGFLNSFLSPPLTAVNAVSAAASGSSAAGNATNQLSFGVLRNGTGFAAFLTALRSESLAKILAEPRVVTLSGRPAYIISGGEAPIVTSSSGGSGVQYKQFGTVVNFLPIVLGNGKIHLEVRPELSTIDAAVGINVASTGSIATAPGFRVRSAQVSVQLEDGQTFAIGGLIQNTVNSAANKIPVLGDVPFFGTLFRTTSYTEIEEELLILVTPRLVDPLACHQVPKVLPGRETRGPDDFELFLEGILEAPRGQRDCFPGGHYLAAHKSPNAGPLPCGDSPNPNWGRHRGGNQCSCGNAGCNGVHTFPYTFNGNHAAARRATLGEIEDALIAPGSMPSQTPAVLPTSGNQPTLLEGN